MPPQGGEAIKPRKLIGRRLDESGKRREEETLIDTDGHRRDTGHAMACPYNIRRMACPYNAWRLACPCKTGLAGHGGGGGGSA